MEGMELANPALLYKGKGEAAGNQPEFQTPKPRKYAPKMFVFDS